MPPRYQHRVLLQHEVLRHSNILLHALPDTKEPTARSCRTPFPYAIRQPDPRDQATTCREQPEDLVYSPPGPNDRARPPLSATWPHYSSLHDLFRSIASLASPTACFTSPTAN